MISGVLRNPWYWTERLPQSRHQAPLSNLGQQLPSVQQIPPPAVRRILEPLYQNLVPMLGKRKRETFLPSNVEPGNQAKRKKCSAEFRATDDAANESRAHTIPTTNDSAVEHTAEEEASSESWNIASPDHQSSSSRTERGAGEPSSRRDPPKPSSSEVDDERNRAKKLNLSGYFGPPSRGATSRFA